MADEKPKEKPGASSAKPPAKPAERDLFVDIVGILLLLVLLNGIFTSIANFVQTDPLYRSGWRSLTPHGIVLAYTRPIASLSNPIGARVLATRDSTDVLDDAGGRRIGTQSFGAKGTITQGPVQVAGTNYYYVDFDSGTDGWVAEDEIAYMDGQPSTIAKILLFLWTVVTWVKIILFLIIIAMFVALVIIVRRLTAIRVNNREKMYPLLPAAELETINPKWERVLTHIESVNENDWRLAIIEADIMLSELLDTMHLVGDSIGEKLKGVERSDFTTIDSAWEAHKVRNEIAHSGGDFHLSQREALRVIELYKTVFKEFQFI